MTGLDSNRTGSTSTDHEENDGQDEEDNTGIERFDEWHEKLLMIYRRTKIDLGD